MMTPDRFLAHLRERILVFDGAMGTNLQRQSLTPDRFGGHDGCNEALNLFAPEAVRKVHADFVAAGCRAVETNTFGANRLTLAEYGLDNKVDAINKAAVRIAREALETGRGGETRFVAASIGPTSRLPSLGHIGFEELAAVYAEQVRSLWEAGADLFVIETCQDLLQIKAALSALSRLFRQEGARRPVMVSVTLEAAGTMLMGSDIGAVQAVLEPFGMIDVIGVNCATGPLEMMRHVKSLAEATGKAVSVMPNAGLPENIGGKPHYRLPPAEFAAFHRRFVEEYGVNVVGGCCGTTPDHLAAAAAAVGSLHPLRRDVKPVPAAASLYGAVSLRQEPAPCLVGERTNANGSRQFRDLLLASDWDSMTAMGKLQARGGAHLIDLSTAYVGRSELADMGELVPRFAKQVKLPLVIDSTDPAVIRAALQRHGGRCVINSVNLEDGGSKLRQVAELACEYGAALICLAIDEKGMAKTCRRKLDVVRRLHDILTREFGLRDEDLIFDTLTFTIGSGDPELRTAARETLGAVKAVAAEFPACQTILGVSNVSFGLAPAAREVLNSIFLAEAVANGLTMAIVNPAGILPPFRIPRREHELALNVLRDAAGDGSDLTAYMQAFSGTRKKTETATDRALTPAEMLHDKVLDGDRSGIEAILDAMRHDLAPERIITDHLIAAMREVGDLFGRGEMQLPFVLQSAEIVRASVDLLRPHLGRKAAEQGPVVILATVAGDVHDIGKNLVRILFENNGYRVVDLGIKIDIDTMIRAAEEHGADIIGMSGLLVRSTQIMKENLEELVRRGLRPSVILGGAALTREFVENDLRALYGNRVHYAADAFDGLAVLDRIAKDTPVQPTARQAAATEIRPATGITGMGGASLSLPAPACRRSVLESPTVWTPAFTGTRVVTLGADDLLDRIDTRVLFQARWGYKQGKRSDAEYAALLDKEARPALALTRAQLVRENLLDIRGVFGFFRCRSIGNELHLLDDEGRMIALFGFPRQQQEPGYCIADFFSSAHEDVIPLWAVTIGPRVAAREAELMKANRYREYLHLHGLGIELAEAAAAETARRAVTELAGQAVPPRATRFSFGFPACPNLTLQKDLLKLLDAGRIGITLTETFQMVPELSVSGFVTLHPQACYFQI